MQLPDGWRIHPTFHVSALKPYVEGRTVQPPTVVLDDSESDMHPDCILDTRTRTSQNCTVRDYLIRWQGCSSINDTWEAADNLPNEAAGLLQRFWEYRNECAGRELQIQAAVSNMSGMVRARTRSTAAWLEVAHAEWQKGT